MWKQMLPALRMTILLTVLTGLAYPGIVTGLCQVMFRDKANGSLLSKDGRVVGSTLIGQNFTRPEYFHPRPSVAGNDGYDATASAGSNLGPTSQKLMDRVKASADQFRKDNPDYKGPIPVDLMTTSASGLDPDISPAAAFAQAARIASARQIPVEQVNQLVARFTQSRDLGFLGEQRVNVLLMNMELDRQVPRR